MNDKIRTLIVSVNPSNTGRILVDEEVREISKRIKEGSYRDKFELHKQTATTPGDLQNLMLTYRPQIVHFCGHGSNQHKIILGGPRGRGQLIDQAGLASMFALYKRHLKLVLLNACFSSTQARSIAEVIRYSIGTSRPIGDKAAVTFAGAFYRALGFGGSVQEAFASAKAELALGSVPRSRGFELFVQKGVNAEDRFPRFSKVPGAITRRKHAIAPTRVQYQLTVRSSFQQTILIQR